MSNLPIERLRAQHSDALLATHAQHGDDTAIVKAAQIVEVMRFLRDDAALSFDQLIDLTCVDTLGLDARTLKVICGTPEPGVAAEATRGRFHVVYHLRSMHTGKRLRVKAVVDESEDGDYPEIDSVASLWKAANWAEREAWDMYGVKFRGHPDLRRILMYEEFIGHPLRKDYPKEKRQPLVRRDWT